MSIFVDENTKVIVQGLTGGAGPLPRPAQQGLRHQGRGRRHAGQGRPGRRGHPRLRHGGGGRRTPPAPTPRSCPSRPKAAPAAILEAAEAGIAFVVCITEGIPAQDEARVFNTLRRDHPGTRLLGPNCPGIISPGKCNIGITAGEIARCREAAPVGIVSRSGTLTYQALYELKQQGIGVIDLRRHRRRPGARHVVHRLPAPRSRPTPTRKAVIMIGEIGGSAEEEAAEFIKASMTKPVAAYIAGVTAPPGKKMGHAGAIVSRRQGHGPGRRWTRCGPPACRSG